MAENGTDVSENLQEAFRLLQAGKAEDGEILLLRPVVVAEREQGVGSLEFVHAANDLGRYLILAGEAERAVETFRRACDGPMPKDDEAIKTRLTCQSNLGEALRAVGEWEEAEDVLRDALARRREFYGKDHPGYAYGLEPLAELLQAEERFDDALALIETAAFNYAQNEHPRFVYALALRAEIMARAGRATPIFPVTMSLGEEALSDLVDAVQERIAGDEPEIARMLLTELLPMITEGLGEDSDAAVHVMTLIAENERQQGAQGDADLRIDSLQRVAMASTRRGDAVGTLRALQGLALAQSEWGDSEGALATYRDAEKRTERLGDPAERSRFVRNFGLYLAEVGEKDEAERLLREAVSDASFAEDADLRARAQVALGIFLQHAHQSEDASEAAMDEAKALLEAALSVLNPIDPDAVSARGHRDAILAGSACTCRDTGLAIAAAFREYLLPQMPADLVKDIDIDLTEDSQFEVGLDVKRQPTEAEHERIQRIINQGLAEFRKRLGR